MFITIKDRNNMRLALILSTFKNHNRELVTTSYTFFPDLYS